MRNSSNIPVALELHKVPISISDQDLGERVVQVLFLTGVSINQDYIVQCHILKKKENSSHCKIKRTVERYSITVHRSNPKGKNDHLKTLGFKNAVIIIESMCPGYKYLHYLGRKLLRNRQIHSYWFSNNQLNINWEERGDINIIEQIDNFVELGLLLDLYMT